jgi:hypothetical protein
MLEEIPTKIFPSKLICFIGSDHTSQFGTQQHAHSTTSLGSSLQDFHLFPLLFPIIHSVTSASQVNDTLPYKVCYKLRRALLQFPRSPPEGLDSRDVFKNRSIGAGQTGFSLLHFSLPL